jgi:Leucine-rich repeat (LRR) protein
LTKYKYSYDSVSFVNFPDRHFKYALIPLGIDTNNDSEISTKEAEGVTSLDVSSWKTYISGGKCITDLTGIEAFINLESLDCQNNHLTTLDVSKNTLLEL